MHPAHPREALEGEAQDRAHLALVHAPGERGHQHHAQARLGAGLHGPLLDLPQRPAPKGDIRRVLHAVELQVYAIKARLPQFPRVARLLGQAQAVGIELREGEAHLLYHAQDIP